MKTNFLLKIALKRLLITTILFSYFCTNAYSWEVGQTVYVCFKNGKTCLVRIIQPGRDETKIEYTKGCDINWMNYKGSDEAQWVPNYSLMSSSSDCSGESKKGDDDSIGVGEVLGGLTALAFSAAFIASLDNKKQTRFKKMESNAIYDKKLEKEWYLGSKSEHDWKTASKICNKYGGRLPTIQAFDTIRKESEIETKEPIPPFSKLDGNYWTSTIDTSDDDCVAQTARFGGAIDFFDKCTNSYEVICIREPK